MYSKAKVLMVTILILGLFSFISGCSEDNIPNTPSAPFLFTNIAISNSITPKPGTTLIAGQTVNFNFEVAYTLAPEQANNNSNVNLFIGFLAVDAVDSVLVVSPFPAAQSSLTANSDNVSVSSPIIIPATNPATQQKIVLLDLVATFLNTSNDTFVSDANGNIIRDDQTWPIQ